MPRHKKKFIDKKNAVTFHLVHRSQQDPMLVSEDSQHVLLPAGQNSKEKQLEEQRKFGVYFDDNYNYLQHLKEADETCVMEEVETFKVAATQPVKPKPDQKLVLPSTVFASTVETSVGLLNKAAPHSGPKIGWDPDIVATLDGDFDYDDPEGEMEDDFFIKANELVEGEEAEDDDMDDSSDVSSNAAGRSDDDDDDVDEFYMEETKSHFTNYSMTSSILPRSEVLVDLDDQFEKFFEQYDESEIGALDFDDIDGNVDENCERMNKLLKDYQEMKAEGKMEDILKTVTVKAVDMGDISSEEEEVEEVEEDKGEKWDCESILSTYSNLYNRPKLIEEPKKDKKIKLNRMGIPSESFSRPLGLVKKDLEDAMNSSVISEISIRDKNESKEAKKWRKQAVKEQKKERRVEKKLNKEAFKEAHLKQQREIASVHKNMRSMVIS